MTFHVASSVYMYINYMRNGGGSVCFPRRGWWGVSSWAVSGYGVWCLGKDRQGKSERVAVAEWWGRGEDDNEGVCVWDYKCVWISLRVEVLREAFNITAPSDWRHGLLRLGSIFGIRGRRTSYLSSSLLNSDVATQARWSCRLSKARIIDIYYLENKAAKDP